jgi:hypothetical protein
MFAILITVITINTAVISVLIYIIRQHLEEDKRDEQHLNIHQEVIRELGKDLQRCSREAHQLMYVVEKYIEKANISHELPLDILADNVIHINDTQRLKKIE